MGFDLIQLQLGGPRGLVPNRLEMPDLGRTPPHTRARAGLCFQRDTLFWLIFLDFG
jgi:hypothetical protein